MNELLLLMVMNAAAAVPAPRVVKSAWSLPLTAQQQIYSPDGSALAAGIHFDGRAISIIETKTGRQIGRLEVPEEAAQLGETQSFVPAAISWNGERLLARLTSSKDGGKTNVLSLLLFNIKDESFVKIVHTAPSESWQVGGWWYGSDISSEGFLPDGSFILTQKFKDSSSYRLLAQDGEDRTPKWLRGVRTSLWSGLERESGRMLAVSADNSGCEVRDVVSGARLSFLEGCVGMRFSFSLTGRWILGRADLTTGKAFIWEAGSGKLMKSFSLGNNAIGVHLLDERRIARLDTSTTPVRFQELDSHTGASVDVALLDPALSVSVLLDVLANGTAMIALSGEGNKVVAVRSPWSQADFKMADSGSADTASGPAPKSEPSFDVDVLPATAMRVNSDAYAIVIGVEKYRQPGVPGVAYAASDARTMYSYLTRSMGFDANNVVLLTDAQAGKVDFDKYFGKWLKNRVGPKSRVFVYYAGHGAPNPATGEGFLMPYEADPSYLDETAYPVARLYSELGKLPTKNVTVVLDACFSGQGERSLIAKGTRPLIAVMKTKGPANAMVIAAATGSQISASDHRAKHGLLTYHLLTGLHGAADADRDGKITVSEAYAYARPAVERAAKLQNVEQTPTFSGQDAPGADAVWITVAKP